MLPDCIAVKVCSKCGDVHPALIEYFKPDKRRPDGLGSWCRKCARDSQAEYYRNNTEKCIAATVLSHKRNPQGHLNTVLRWQAKFPEKKKAITDKWFADHKEYRKEYSRLYGLENPNIFRVNAQRRRARIHGLPCTLTDEEWQDILTYYNNACAYCGTPQSHLDHTLHQEHIIPVVRGGGYTKENIVPSCEVCNGRKWRRTPEEAGMTLLK